MASLAQTDYAKWAMYDPDAALTQADLQEAKEDRERIRRKARKDLLIFETKVITLTSDVASAATSRAKVERLKRMKKNRRGRKKNNETTKPTSSSTTPPTIVEHVDITRGINLQIAAEARTTGMTLLGGNMTSTNPIILQHFERSTAAAEALLSNLPSLPSSVRFIPVPQKKTKCGCGRGHEEKSECLNDEEQGTQKDGEANDAASLRLANIALVGLRVLNDARVGLARCLLTTSPVDVVGHLKRVLLSDDSRADAWLLRGKAFDAMQVPLLAQLHYKRALEEYQNVNNPYSKEIEEVEATDAGKYSSEESVHRVMEAL